MSDIGTSTEYDIHFYWDPVCPFAWLTSRWIHEVKAQRDYSVDWRFISLRILNKNVDYDSHFPPEYEAGHTGGKKMLRMAAAIRADKGREAMEPLYTALGASIFDTPPATEKEADVQKRLAYGTAEQVTPILEQLGWSTDFAAALDDEGFDAELEAETDEALALTGKDVGTPIINFLHGRDETSTAFFGPVISRVPTGDDAVRLWDAVVELSTFPGFAELKRSLREMPQLRAFGFEPGGDAGKEEDWHGGSRRQKK